MSEQKFLIIQTAFIGDAILASGILEKLKRFFPDAQIDLLVRKGNDSLFVGHPYLHELLVWNKKQKKIINLFKMLRKIRAAKYTKVINLHRFASSGIFTAFSGADEKIGFDKNPLSFLFDKRIKHVIGRTGNPKHEIERNNDLIKEFTDGYAAKPRLYPSEADYASVLGYQKSKYITIAPASVWFTKQFPAEKWSEFLNRVPGDVRIYLTGGPQDKGFADEVKARTSHRDVINLCGRLSLLQSAALMSKALMNYTNDSAPLHIASSVNGPVTAVYCSTIPAFGFGPLSDQSFIVEINENLDCRPCGLHGKKACPLGHFNCAYKISVDQLLLPRAE